MSAAVLGSVSETHEVTAGSEQELIQALGDLYYSLKPESQIAALEAVHPDTTHGEALRNYGPAFFTAWLQRTQEGDITALGEFIVGYTSAKAETANPGRINQTAPGPRGYLIGRAEERLLNEKKLQEAMVLGAEEPLVTLATGIPPVPKEGTASHPTSESLVPPPFLKRVNLLGRRGTPKTEATTNSRAHNKDNGKNDHGSHGNGTNLQLPVTTIVIDAPSNNGQKNGEHSNGQQGNGSHLPATQTAQHSQPAAPAHAPTHSPEGTKAGEHGHDSHAQPQAHGTPATGEKPKADGHGAQPGHSQAHGTTPQSAVPAQQAKPPIVHTTHHNEKRAMVDDGPEFLRNLVAAVTGEVKGWRGVASAVRNFRPVAFIQTLFLDGPVLVGRAVQSFEFGVLRAIGAGFKGEKASKAFTSVFTGPKTDADARSELILLNTQAFLVVSSLISNHYGITLTESMTEVARAIPGRAVDNIAWMLDASAWLAYRFGDALVGTAQFVGNKGVEILDNLLNPKLIRR